MSRIKIFFSTFVLLAALIFSSNLPAAESASGSDEIVVMVSVDGLAAFYFDDPKAEMPNIRALASAGAMAKSMKASNPTVTWPNHTTLVTGVTPARHGVVGNNYYDRAQKKRITLILDPTYDKDEIVKVPTIYDMAKSNGLKTAAMNWPASRNAKTLDWTAPEVRYRELMEKYTTPSVLKECEQNGIHLLDEIFPSGKRQSDASADATFARVLNQVIAQHRPQLALLHLANVDHTEHATGPRSPESYEAIKIADAQIGEIWRELQRDFPNRATLFVVSDHGFSPIQNMILPNVILRKAGLITVDGKKITGGSVQTVPQAGSAMLYVTDEKNRDDIIKKIEKAFRHATGISKVVGPNQLEKYGMANPKDDPNAPDVMLFAKEGFAFGDTAAGDLTFEEKPERRGTHGYEASLPDLHATFIAWGRGIKPGARLGEIKNVDVAPTIAKLLKIELPSTDGKPLKKILE